MPKMYPPEFKRDVVAVARTSGLTHAQIVMDFGISKHSVQRWLAQADIDDGVVDGTTSVQHDELAALRRRNRVLEQEVEILRRPRPTCQGRGPKMTYPLVRDLAVGSHRWRRSWAAPPSHRTNQATTPRCEIRV